MTSTNDVSHVLSKQINGFDVRYVAAGSGEPLVLVHGSVSDLRYWADQMAPFSESFTVFAPSTRPYWPKTTAPAEGQFSVPQYVEDLKAFIRSLDLGPVHLCGHSLGGHIALRVASSSPQLVRSLVLAEPGGPLAQELTAGAANPGAPTTVANVIAEAAARQRAGDVDGGLALILDAASEAGRGWSHGPEAFKSMARANAHTLAAQAVEQRPAITLHDLEAIKAPVLLVGGERTPQPFPRVLDVLERHIKDAARVSIPGASHIMNMQNPEAFNAAVLNFLRSHSGSLV